MCDCYEHKCESCATRIQLHIADFCTRRENVHVYCPQCVRAGDVLRPYTRTYQWKGEGRSCSTWKGTPCAQVFVDTVAMPQQILLGEKAVGVPGEVVLILCDDPQAYGIHLN